MNNSPLKLPSNFPDSCEDPRAEFLKRHPWWGWLVAQCYPDKWGVLEKEFIKQLQSRFITMDEAWSMCPQYKNTLFRLQRILNEQLWDFDIVFIPEDPYRIIGQFVTGDLCEVEAFITVEEEFKFKADEKDLSESMTMLDFVKYIESHKTVP